MSTLGGLARFTPRLLDHETLEALFVHREHLVVDVVARIERASTSSERSCRLFVGPRGAGKTHLVSLVYHRAKQLSGFGARFQIAWLPEDLWAIGSYEDLLQEILKRLEPASGVDGDRPPSPDPSRAIAERVAAGGPIVVIIENLDTVLEDIGPSGRRQLRSAVESDRSLLLVATATRLTAALQDQDEPFYGFFDTFDLQAFDVDQAAEMLKRIAEARGDGALVAELGTQQTKARLAAVAHLAGGQPRIWALFGAGLTVEGLDDLVSVLIERFDDLTPYYQEQLRRLSVHERKAVQTLAEADRPVPVKELSLLTGIDERSLGGTMTKLRKAGWVKPRTGLLVEMADRRLTYYELAEPLARLAFQLKSSNGAPVRMVVDFLRLWFEPDDLSGATASGVLAHYISAALEPAGADAAVLQAARVVASGGRSAQPIGPEAVEVLLAVEAGLGALHRGDTSALLQQPSTISVVIEEQLRTKPLSEVWLLVHLRGVRSNDPRWLERAKEAVDLLAPVPPGWMALMAAWALKAERDEEPAYHLYERALRGWADAGRVSEVDHLALAAMYVGCGRSLGYDELRRWIEAAPTSAGPCAQEVIDSGLIALASPVEADAILDHLPPWVEFGERMYAALPSPLPSSGVIVCVALVDVALDLLDGGADPSAYGLTHLASWWSGSSAELFEAWRRRVRRADVDDLVKRPVAHVIDLLEDGARRGGLLEPPSAHA